MLKFEEFTQSKKCEEFTYRLTEAARGYADFMQIGVVDAHQIFKVVINPEGKRTVAFVAGLHGDEPGGPMGVLKFIENKPYIPKTKRVVIIPLANPTGFLLNTRKTKNGVDLNREFLKDELTGECEIIWNALKDEDLNMLHTIHEDTSLSTFYLYYTHDKKLANDIKDLAKKYFKLFNGDEVNGDKVQDGLVPLPHIKKGTLEDRVLSFGIPYITTETPGKSPMIKRTRFTEEAMKTVIHYI